MQPHGGDRVRFSGGRAILHSPVSKGWTPRVPKQGTHSVHPGTAVLWDGECFEVIDAAASVTGGVRYVLAPWLDEHVIRVLDHYDAESEERRSREYETVMRQRKQHGVARFSGMILGHLPAVVQNRLANDLGVFPPRMTIASCLPPLVLFGVCVHLSAGAFLEQRTSPVPSWLMLAALYCLVESAVRFQIAMSQNRGVGSAVGFLLYVVYWLTVMRRDPAWSPFVVERGDRLFTLPPPEDVARRDAVEWRGPFFSLLSVDEQTLLERQHGYNYRRHAFGLTWAILLLSAAGAVSSLMKVLERPTLSATSSLLLAGFLSFEQIWRLRLLRKGPAGSVAGILVRPFVQRFLREGFQ